MAIVCCSYLLAGKTAVNAEVDRFYVLKLKKLQSEVLSFQQQTKANAPQKTLKERFLQMRHAYKELAVLTDFFNPYETKQINGPAMARVEEDHPTVVLEPHGFGVLEEQIFLKKEINKTIVLQEADYVLRIINRLMEEPDRIHKFSSERVWQAMHAAIIRVVTLGITGFDSPLAQHSIPEARASIFSLSGLFQLYQNDVPAYQKEILESLLKDAIRYLEQHEDFNSFDRLHFIRTYANPITHSITTIRKEKAWIIGNERAPLNPEAANLFAEDAFDVSFFSPNERYRVTPERIELGRRLFYDPSLSATGSRSCASCHQPEKAFTDGRKKPLSLDGKTTLLRNTPGLWNTVFQTRQFYDSRTLTLENQLSDVVHNTDEMKGSLKESIGKLGADPLYAGLFSRAYGNQKEPVTEYSIANAISSYVRSLVALNSRFDQYMRGNNGALNKKEQKGFNLFAGKAKCATCHFIPLFNGLVPHEFHETESEVLGVPAIGSKRKATLDPDEGKAGFTKATVHRFAFKTPTLRNVELTAPYMHNGVFATLEEVLHFYNKGGGAGLGIAPPNQTLPAQKLRLSLKEQQQVIAFMKALTDTTTHR
jgi:cytochrome c peroxidase